MAPSVARFAFSASDGLPFIFNAGQYIMLVKPAEAGETKPTIRAYSIASPPHQSTTIEIIANEVPEGHFTPWLFSRKVGDRLTMRPPRGHFALAADSPNDSFFIATGTGIGPLRSMILDLLHRGTSKHLTLLWGLRSESGLYLQEELSELSRQYANFTSITTLSRPSGAWQGETGRVTHYLSTRLPSIANTDFYLCGNGAMISEVKEILGQKGSCPIYTEKYY